MRNTVYYEWKLEAFDKYGDIQYNDHDTTLAGLLQNETPDTIINDPDGYKTAVCLVRNYGNDDDGLQDRYHCYINDGQFNRRYDEYDGTPPKRFYKELERFAAKHPELIALLIEPYAEIEP